MFTSAKRICSDQRGITALEFALIAPAFLAMVFGGLQISAAFFKGNTTKWAIERAARIAVLSPDITEEDLQTRVDELLAGINSDLQVDIDYVIDTSPAVPLGQLTGNYEHVVEVPFFEPKTLTFSTTISVPLLQAAGS